VQVLSITHGIEGLLALTQSVRTIAVAGGADHLMGPPSFRNGLPLPLVTTVVGGLFLGTLAISRFSLRAGIPAILGVMLFGLAINTTTPLISHDTIEWLHTLSLSILLFYAGLCTELRSIRGFLEYGLSLAIGGVLISSLLLGLIVWFVSSPTANGIELGFNQIPIAVAMLIAACLGSTDAGATISVLSGLAKPLPKRLQSLLEFESSVNDPAAILVLGAVVGLFTVSQAAGGEMVLMEQIQMFLQKIGSGVIVGVILGYVARFSLETFVDHSHQLLILGVAIALLSYGLAETLGGSGFIAPYVTGLFMSNHIYRNSRVNAEMLVETLLPFNTMTEITIFLLFGLEMHPAKMLGSLPEGIVIALGMMLIARPLSVLAFQWLSPFNLKESLLISWCGLRGAVPLALSFTMVDAIPEVRGIDPALVPQLVTNAEVIVFCVVVLNLLIQGLSLGPLARWLNLSETNQPAGAGRLD
jgi:cell volume regulation protein A